MAQGKDDDDARDDNDAGDDANDDDGGDDDANDDDGGDDDANDDDDGGDDDANDDDDGNDDFQTEAARLRAEATALQDALSNHRETCRWDRRNRNPHHHHQPSSSHHNLHLIITVSSASLDSFLPKEEARSSVIGRL